MRVRFIPFSGLGVLTLVMLGVMGLQGCDMKATQSEWLALQQKLQNPRHRQDERPPLVKAEEVLAKTLANTQTSRREAEAAPLATIHPVTLEGKKTGIQLKGWLYDPIRTERLRQTKATELGYLEAKVSFLEGKLKILRQAIASEEELDPALFKLEGLLRQFHKTHPSNPSNVEEGPHGTAVEISEPANRQRPILILCHGLGQTHHHWGDLPAILSKAGYVVLTLDLPGHGESTTRIDRFSKKPILLDWHMFNPEDWQSMDDWMQDALQALFRSSFTEQFPESPLYKVSFIGSGYGGLLAMTVAGSKLISEAPEVQKGVFLALSPPLSQKGVEGLFTASNMTLPSWIGAGDQTSIELVNARKYCRIIQASCALAHFKTVDGTGIDLLNPAISPAESLILQWLKETLPVALSPEEKATHEHATLVAEPTPTKVPEPIAMPTDTEKHPSSKVPQHEDEPKHEGMPSSP
ncbi:MAG: alpha/beta hydrolase [Vampirovibrionales bacterium]